MIELGYIRSVIITTLIYLFIGIISIKIYDTHKVDYFWLESLKRAQAKYARSQIKNGSFFYRFILRRGWFNRLAISSVFSLKNPGLTVIYLRKGSYRYNGFSGKNIKLHFAIYLLFANVFWNEIVLLLAPIFKIIGLFIGKLFEIIKWYFIIRII